MDNSDFVARFEKNVLSTIKTHNLIRRGEKILVAVSGGKDSTAVLYILNKYFPNVEAITINAFIGSYSAKSLESIKAFCSKHKIKLHIISFRQEFGKSLCYIRSALSSRSIKLTSCAICGILKRYLLNKKALQLKASKLATGHNLDDEAQSFMINLLRSNIEASARLGPLAGIITDRKFVPRIKPLYFAPEKDVERYSRIMGFPVIYGRCPCSANAYRRLVGSLLDDMEKKNKKLKLNIVSYFLNALPALKSKRLIQEVLYCRQCHQPSRSSLCRTCQILSIVNRQV